MEQNPIAADVEYSKMNAELKQATDAGFWTQWPGLLVNNTFPLRRLLGSSYRGAVFLTEHKAKNLPDAAIKFVRVDGRSADPLLEQWAGAATLDHPNLVRLFETGRYRFAEQEFVFVVMEYADQTLAEILQRRALHPDEMLEMLAPTLEAMTFLHRRHLVHLQVKPSNVLAVGDQLKLASDTIRPLGQRAVGVTVSYDPPELKDHGITTAGDVWSLGATLVEALTQRTPSGSDLRFEQDLPAGLPSSLRDTVRRCLSLMHTDRPSVIELRSEYKSGASVPEARPSPAPSAAQAPLQSPIQPAPSPVQPQPSLHVQLRARVEPAPSEPRPPIQPMPPQPQPSLQVRLRPRVPAPPAQPQGQIQSPPVAPPVQPQLQPQIQTPVAQPQAPVQPQSSQAQPQLQTPPRPQLQAPLAQPQSSQAQLPREPRPQAEMRPAQSQPQLETQLRPQILTPPAQPQAPVQSSQPQFQTQPRPETQTQTAQSQPQIQPPAPHPQPQVESQPRPQIQAPPVQSRPQVQAQPTQSQPQIQPPAPQPQAQFQSQLRPQVQTQPAQAQAQTQTQPPAPRAQPQIESQLRLQAQPVQAKLQIQPPSSQAQAEQQRSQVQTKAIELRPVESKPEVQRPPKRQARVEEKADSLLEAAPTGTSAKRAVLLLVIAAVLAISIWAWLDFRSPDTAATAVAQAPVTSIPIPAAPEPAAEETEEPTEAAITAEQPPEAAANSVIEEVIPKVPTSIQNKIQGHIYVTVRVLVEPKGDVAAVLMERPGPSKYFARLADNAARNWKFAPTEDEGTRVWRLNYLFTRDDVTVHATEQ